MRTHAIVPLVSLLALLAGCMGATTPPGTSDTGSQPGSDSPTGSSSDVPVGPGMGMLVPPERGQAENASLRLEGIADRSAVAQGESVTFTYNVTNLGADAITWGGCYVPYSFALRGSDGRNYPLQVPMAQCLGFTSDPFPAGATMGFQTTWNGTYAEGETYVQAPEGAYEFIATFTAYRGEAQDDRAAVSLSLPIGVLPPNSMA